MTVIDAVELIFEHGPATKNPEEVQEWNFAIEHIMDCLDLMYCAEQDRIIIRQN